MEMTILKKLKLPDKGKYVVAVSGGIDSMSLLHLLVRYGNYELVVAHCNHGIRPDANEDERLVHDTARHYGLEFQAVRLSLKPDTSEATARDYRYEFLHQVRKETGAKALILAHHLDDRVETMLLNQRRGAGWLGLAPLKETATIKRPLLEVTKNELRQYAHQQRLSWREDSTNLDPDYTPRNRVRQELEGSDRDQLYRQLRDFDARRSQREEAIKVILDRAVKPVPGGVSVDRTELRLGDVATCRDVLYFILRTYFIEQLEIDYDNVIRLEHFYKTAAPSKKLPLSASVWARMEDSGMVITVS